jgi:hypothetical protein
MTASTWLKRDLGFKRTVRKIQRSTSNPQRNSKEQDVINVLGDCKLKLSED